MAFEDIKARMALLLEETHDRPDGLHGLYQNVLQELNELRALDMPLPEELLELERALEEKFRQNVIVTER
jgi:hypothetical protein